MSASGTRADAVVRELLSADDAELLGVMQRNVEVLLNPSFASALRQIARSAPSDELRDDAARIEESVLAFLGEFVAHVEALDKAAQADAGGGEVDEAEVAQARAAVAESERTPRRADGSSAPIRRRAAPQPRMPADAGGVGAPTGDTARRAAPVPTAADRLVISNRARLEGVLRAASSGVDALEAELERMTAAGELDAGFIDHLRWEIEQQVEQRNGQLLHILQIVVQRACLAAESTVQGAQVGTRHLSALLQLHDREARRAYWQRVIVALPPRERAEFGQAVCTVFADIGLRVQRGADIDDGLLRQIRAVRDELDEFLTEGAADGSAQ